MIGIIQSHFHSLGFEFVLHGFSEVDVMHGPVLYQLRICRYGILWPHPVTHESGGIIKTDMVDD